MKKVVKFGGSSLASAEQFKKSRRYHPGRQVQTLCSTFCSGEKRSSSDTKGHRYALQLLQSCDP